MTDPWKKEKLILGLWKIIDLRTKKSKRTLKKNERLVEKYLSKEFQDRG